jgi:hypothetical protein
MNLAVAHQLVAHREQIWEKDLVSVLCVTQVAQPSGLMAGKIVIAKINQLAPAIHALQDRRTLILMGLQDRKGAVPQKNIDRAVVAPVRKQRQQIMLNIDL